MSESEETEVVCMKCGGVGTRDLENGLTIPCRLCHGEGKRPLTADEKIQWLKEGIELINSQISRINNTTTQLREENDKLKKQIKEQSENMECMDRCIMNFYSKLDAKIIKLENDINS